MAPDTQTIWASVDWYTGPRPEKMATKNCLMTFFLLLSTLTYCTKNKTTY